MITILFACRNFNNMAGGIERMASMIMNEMVKRGHKVHLITWDSINSKSHYYLNPKISSFFFCTLLFYLFFEVFFSFLRKLIQKRSPIYPDDKHLHMLSFYKISSIYGKSKGNYLNSIIINLSYLILIIPGLYLMGDPDLSRYWFFITLLIYLIIYSRLYHLTKN